jgi:hypothetical protein
VQRFALALDEELSVEVRLNQLNGRWIASADTPDGPSLGCAGDALAAVYLAVDPLQPGVDAALDVLPWMPDEIAEVPCATSS